MNERDGIEAFLSTSEEATPIRLVAPQRLAEALAALPDAQAAWARRQGFAGKAGEVVCLPGADGGVAGVLAGAGEEDDAPTLAPGALADRLPAGVYRFDTTHAEHLDTDLLLLGWLLSAYRFRHYRDGEGRKRDIARLLPPEGADMHMARAQARAVWLGRNLINTPANDLGPAELAAAARGLAEEFDGDFREVTGAALKRGFPLIHAVGRGAEQERAPRLIDLRWGKRGPRITLVGKGVCFDSGGLDIKPASAMSLMKKDMGGAAAALSCARMVMETGLPVRLRVLVPAVENAVSGSAFRPGDVWRARNGLTVEIGNTDAEGRLVLADALSLADEEKPDLLVDFATLTGSARVALGPALPPVFSPDEALAEKARTLGRRLDDPVWPLPLFKPYMEGLKSAIADINNITSNGFAGAITAALFLSCFVSETKQWLHFDIYGWNPTARPARPKGGEPQAARLAFHLIREHLAA